MKYDWNYLTEKIENPSDFPMFLIEIEDILSQSLDFDTFEVILKEIRLKTHYMTDHQKLIWSIFRYLQILFSLDFDNFTKKISKKHLERELLINKNQKEQSIKENPNKTTLEKDFLLEHLEKTYQNELLILNSTYSQQYSDWLNENKTDVHEYVQLKIKIEEWFKAHYQSLSV